MQECLQYSKNIIVAVDEVDFLERLKISAILQYFQDIATVHAEQLGIGYSQMRSKNLIWVLNRVSACIYRQPHSEETIRLETYPRKPNAVDAVRDYYAYDENENMVFTGTSKWCVLDTETRALRRVAPLFNFEAKMYRSEIALMNGNPAVPEIPTGSKRMVSEPTPVRITDLDRNYHMNNARYGDAILNCCDIELLKKYSVKRFDINFLSELKYGDRFHMEYAACNNCTIFEGLREDDNAAFRAQIEWIKNDDL